MLWPSIHNYTFIGMVGLRYTWAALQFKACYIQKHIQPRPSMLHSLIQFCMVAGRAFHFWVRKKKRNKIIMCVHDIFFFFSFNAVVSNECLVFCFEMCNSRLKIWCGVCGVNFLCVTCKESKGNKTQPPNQLYHFKWITTTCFNNFFFFFSLFIFFFISVTSIFLSY